MNGHGNDPGRVDEASETRGHCDLLQPDLQAQQASRERKGILPETIPGDRDGGRMGILPELSKKGICGAKELGYSRERIQGLPSAADACNRAHLVCRNIIPGAGVPNPTWYPMISQLAPMFSADRAEAVYWLTDEKGNDKLLAAAHCAASLFGQTKIYTAADVFKLWQAGDWGLVLEKFSLVSFCLASENMEAYTAPMKQQFLHALHGIIASRRGFGPVIVSCHFGGHYQNRTMDIEIHNSLPGAIALSLRATKAGKI